MESGWRLIYSLSREVEIKCSQEEGPRGSQTPRPPRTLERLRNSTSTMEGKVGGWRGLIQSIGGAARLPLPPTPTPPLQPSSYPSGMEVGLFEAALGLRGTGESRGEGLDQKWGSVQVYRCCWRGAFQWHGRLVPQEPAEEPTFLAGPAMPTNVWAARTFLFFQMACSITII